MAFNVTFKLEDVGQQPASMTITMTVSEWIALRKSLNNDHPGFRLGRAIDSMIDMAQTKLFTVYDK